jgi:hypothetical protein
MEFYCADIEMLMSGWNTLYISQKRVRQAQYLDVARDFGSDDLLSTSLPGWRWSRIRMKDICNRHTAALEVHGDVLVAASAPMKVLDASSLRLIPVHDNGHCQLDERSENAQFQLTISERRRPSTFLSAFDGGSAFSEFHFVKRSNITTIIHSVFRLGPGFGARSS